MPPGKYDADTNELISDFQSRIEALRRNGVPDNPPLGGTLPWAEASEERKLENVVWESMSVWVRGDVISVPDTVRLEAVEQNVDYAKLPEEKRSALQSLRADPDIDIAAALERIAGLEYDIDEPKHYESQAPLGPPVPISPEMDRLLTEVEKSWASEQPKQDYGQFLAEATERAMCRMQGKGLGHER